MLRRIRAYCCGALAHGFDIARGGVGPALRLGLRIQPEHDPEKWIPVFRKDHAQIKEVERHDASKKRHAALGPAK
jgi:hypothetical protein